MIISYLLQVRQADVHWGNWRIYAKKQKNKTKKKKRKLSLQPPDVTGRYSRTETDKDITTNLGSSARQQHVPFRQVEPALDYSLQFTQEKKKPSAPEPDVEQKTPRSDTQRSCSPVRFFLPCRLTAEKASPAQIGVVNPLCVSYLVWNHWQKSSSGAPYWLLAALSVWAGEWRGRTAARHLTEKEPSSPGREAAFKLEMWVVVVGAWN